MHFLHGATYGWVLFMYGRVVTTHMDRVGRINKEGARKKKEGADGGKLEMKEGTGAWGN